MIRSFKDKEAERLLNRGWSRRLPADIQRVAFRRLRMLNRATSLTELSVPPESRLEPLKGDKLGRHSIRINDQWRICFVWKDGAAHEVEIVDYHKSR